MILDYFNTTRLVTGLGCVKRGVALLTALGDRCIIVTGKGSAKKSGALDDLTAVLKEAGVDFELFDGIEPNPSIAGCEAAAGRAKAFGAKFIVGIGGGSPLDAAKAIAALAANDMPPEQIYTLKWPNKALPVVAIGTTAGTGSEVTNVAVITNRDGFKASVKSEQLFPAVAFGDPKYSYSASYDITVSTALDAVSHAAESWFNTAGSHISDMYAKACLDLIYPALCELESTGPDTPTPPEIRERLYYASVLAGYALVKTGTSYPHRLSYFLTEKFAIPHGTACAAFLPAFLRRAAEREPNKSAKLCAGAEYTLEDFAGLVERMSAYRPVEITPDDVEFLIKRGDGTPAFLGAMPAYTAEEARELIDRVFVVKKQ